MGRGTAFRDAHAAVGELIRRAAAADAPLAELVAAHPSLGPEAAELLDPARSLARRNTHGGPGPEALAAQIERFRARLDADRARVGG